MDKVTDIRTDAMMEHLILVGALEISGVDSNTGEMIYSITDILKDVHPQMYEDLSREFKTKMFEMIDAGPKVMQWKFSKEYFGG